MLASATVVAGQPLAAKEVLQAAGIVHGRLKLSWNRHLEKPGPRVGVLCETLDLLHKEVFNTTALGTLGDNLLDSLLIQLRPAPSHPESHWSCYLRKLLVHSLPCCLP